MHLSTSTQFLPSIQVFLSIDTRRVRGSLEKLHLRRFRPRGLGFCEHCRIVWFRHLLVLKPCPIFRPHLHEADSPRFIWILKDVEEQKFWFLSTRIPDGPVSFSPFVDLVGIDFEL